MKKGKYEKTRKEVKTILRAQETYQNVLMVDSFDPDMHTTEEIEVMVGVEEGLIAMKGMHALTQSYLNTESFPDKQKDVLTFVYATYVGAKIAEEKTREPASKHQTEDGFEYNPVVNLKLAKNIDDSLTQIAEKLNSLIKFEQDDKRWVKDGTELAFYVNSYFTVLANSCARALKQFNGLMSETGLDEEDFEINEVRIKGMKVGDSIKTQDSAIDKDSLPELSEMIGNTELVKKGKASIDRMMSYDFEHGKNPVGDGSRVLFMIGTPGCGKTLGAKALARYALEIAEENNLPLEFSLLKTSDFATAFQYESANNLEKKFKEKIFKGDKYHLIYMPDIDTMFSARGAADTRQEDSRTLGVMLDVLDGTLTPGKGKNYYLIICDANFTDSMDNALLSRLKKSTVNVKGPETEADYSELLLDIMLKDEIKSKYVKVTKKQRETIGKFCREVEYSGRNIESIASQIKDELNTFEKPKNWFKMSFKEKEDHKKNSGVKVTGTQVVNIVKDYEAGLRAHDDKLQDDRREKQIQDIIQSMDQEAKFKKELAEEMAKQGLTLPGQRAEAAE